MALFNADMLVNPLGSYQYKLTFNENSLNKFLHGRFLYQINDLSNFKISFGDHFALIYGEIKLSAEQSKKLFGVKKIGFKITLITEKIITRNVILFKVNSFRLFNPMVGRIDLLKILSYLNKSIQKSIVEIFRNFNTPFTFNNSLSTLEADLNIFANMLPNVLGSLDLKHCRFTKNKCTLFAYSNLIMRSLLDIFSPGYLNIQEIDADRDSMQLLWEG